MPQRQFDFLTPGDHLCLIYHSDKERFYSEILFILDGLKRGEMVVAVDDEVRDLLEEFVDVEFSVAKGQLAFLDASEFGFEYGSLIDKLKEMEAGVAERGFKGFRFLINFDPIAEGRILDYESELVRWGRGIALCVFDGEKFGHSTLIKLTMIHPKLIIRKKTVENVFYPVQSRIILGEEVGEREYTLLMETLVELHETVRELDRVRERYRAICNSIPDGIFTLKGEMIVEVNVRFAKMLGFDFREILGRKLYDLSPKRQPDGEESKQKAMKVTKVAIEKGSHFFEWRFKGKGGFVDVEVSLVKFKLDGEYHLVGVVKEVRNVGDAEDIGGVGDIGNGRR